MQRTALVVLVLGSSTSLALAEGEQTPMFGGSVIGSRSPDAPEVAGVQFEIAWWHGRLGVAVEGTQQWGFDRDEGSRVTTAGGSLRLLAFRGYTTSLLEPRDVEFGIELHGVVERAWWDAGSDGAAPVRYGGGIAVRLRGGGDDNFSNLLAESRLFVRFLTTKEDRTEIAARDMTFPVERERRLGVVIGLGASWGGGKRPYVDRFRLRPLDTIVDGRLIRLH